MQAEAAAEPPPQEAEYSIAFGQKNLTTHRLIQMYTAIRTDIVWINPTVVPNANIQRPGTLKTRHLQNQWEEATNARIGSRESDDSIQGIKTNERLIL